MHAHTHARTHSLTHPPARPPSYSLTHPYFLLVLDFLHSWLLDSCSYLCLLAALCVHMVTIQHDPRFQSAGGPRCHGALHGPATMAGLFWCMWRNSPCPQPPPQSCSPAVPKQSCSSTVPEQSCSPTVPEQSCSCTVPKQPCSPTVPKQPHSPTVPIWAQMCSSTAAT